MPHRTHLTGEDVARKALEMIDELGLDGLSMRKLAAALGVAPMTIYSYFTDRDALLDGVAQLLYGEIEAPSGSQGGPRDTLIRIMMSVRGMLLRHPNAITLIASRPPRTLDALAFVEAGCRALRREGISARDTARAYRALAAYSLGTAMTEAGRYFTEHPATQLAAGPLSERTITRHLPNVAEIGPYLDQLDDAAEFEYGLDLTLDRFMTQPEASLDGP
ncbi:TetR/AcrR family transcriptional regulator C-terminal domain-containing protein [Arthrobacter sp. I2-34]|uniref:TetR/AcrR family transcriptional regulator C-terminal domain-containing protein n=1 Tax=Arthrobacter hankyongi TaxID=2904801 RepID=A0ABS9L8D2_9MICC|nr:TetR/AcrR family transcriptional regulator C-terminal domain-containing protein [Arthrobacter hankyongi]MCG2622935.1 TetR/AcrR family transcriptional regulator C-terminal domain-containing protein [Arthrobacter hankyongi]